MKFIFNTKSKVGNFLKVKITDGDKDEIIKEEGVKTLYLGAGKALEMTARKLNLIVRKIIILAKGAKAEQVVLDFKDFNFKHLKLGSLEIGEIIGSELILANYEFTKYKTPPKDGFSFIKEVVVNNIDKEVIKGIEIGKIIAEEKNKMRDLANTPGGDMTPKILAKAARDAVKGLKISVKILGEKEMEKIGMNAILSVGRGSEEESQFIILEYKGAKSSERPIVLVGKGVTFDTGGINLKPSNGLLGMNMDMSGGASVIHAIALCARLKLKKNVVALVPSVENMASGKSYRPGDVIRSMSGKTIEVLNTDAEGRVILADALTYAQKYKPKLVVDVATLTGAACVALGEKASVIFTKDDAIAEKVSKLGEIAGEYVWRLPLWEEYENEIKGSLGDWTNVHNKDSRYGGAIYGAIFLYQFAKEYPWLHIDMAPRMTSSVGDNLAVGSSGEPTELLFKIVENF